MYDPQKDKSQLTTFLIAALCLLIVIGGDFLVRWYRGADNTALPAGESQQQGAQLGSSSREPTGLSKPSGQGNATLDVSASLGVSSGENTSLAAETSEQKALLDGRPGALSAEGALLQTGPRLPIQTPSFEGTIALRGAVIDDLTLLKHKEGTGKESEPVHLLRPLKSRKAYGAFFRWHNAEGTHRPPRHYTGARGSTSTAWVPGPSTLWQIKGGPRLTPQTPVMLFCESPDGLLRFEQLLSVDAHGLFKVKARVVNKSETSLRLRFMGHVLRSAFEPKGEMLAYEGPMAFVEGALQEISYAKLDEKQHIELNPSKGWLGVSDKYWLVALAPKGFFQSQVASKKDGWPLDMAFYGEVLEVPPGFVKEAESSLFVGAKDLHRLDAYEKAEDIPHFDLAIDFGWFYFLTKPIFYTLSWLKGLTGNFGLAILLFTVLLKLLFLPLANKSYRSMAKMKILGPQLEKLRERYKSDPQKMSQEVMAFYKREKVNPVSGCLPMLLQMPFFFALYKVLVISIEARHAPFWGGILDLSAPDPTNIFTLLGVLPITLPGFLTLGLWPFLMGLSMFFQQRMSPPPGDPSQRVVFLYVMPLVFTFMFRNFSAGVVIYWTWNNLLSMAQQWLMARQALTEKAVQRKK